MEWHDGGPIRDMSFALAVQAEYCHWQMPLLVPVSELLHSLGDFNPPPSFNFDINPYYPSDVGSRSA
jgi:hypothetical protein